jgi:hypothetical protein
VDVFSCSSIALRVACLHLHDRLIRCVLPPWSSVSCSVPLILLCMLFWTGTLYHNDALKQ